MKFLDRFKRKPKINREDKEDIRPLQKAAMMDILAKADARTPAQEMMIAMHALMLRTLRPPVLQWYMRGHTNRKVRRAVASVLRSKEAHDLVDSFVKRGDK